MKTNGVGILINGTLAVSGTDGFQVIGLAWLAHWLSCLTRSIVVLDNPPATRTILAETQLYFHKFITTHFICSVQEKQRNFASGQSALVVNRPRTTASLGKQINFSV